MRCLKLTVAYRGTHYCGWQVQDGQPTIQQALEQAFASITGEAIRITGSGRTDSGVHAIGQVASLQTHSTLECFRLLRALNAKTSQDISVLSVEEAPSDFHAIRDAKRKSYGYRLQFGPIPDPLNREFCWFIPTQLDVARMRDACQFLLGEHDFLCFQASGGATKTTVRTLYECSLNHSRQGPFEHLELQVEGNGFLYNMVRNIMGTLVVIGKQKQPPEWIQELIESRDRTLAGETAPPQGLFLMKVDY